MKKVEYRIREVTRYIVTRYEDTGNTGSVSERGEYGNAEIAYEVGYALCKAEHDAAGTPPGDENFQYPARSNVARPLSTPEGQLASLMSSGQQAA